MDKPLRRHEDLPESVLAAFGHARPDKVDAFLDEHTELARLRSEELRDDLSLQYWRTRVEHWSGILKLSFELGLAVLVLVVLTGTAVALWTAAHDNALVIDPFSVPPDLAARGLDGRVVAAHLEDRLAELQAATESVRPADSYAGDWGNDIKVQIPETGISIGEVYHLMVVWLGNQTHITGEVWRTADGYAVTTRTGTGSAVTLSGPKPGLDGLLQKTAESIYERTQPYRYAVYLMSFNRPPWARIRSIYQNLAETGSRRERAWAYVGLANVDSNTGDLPRSFADLHRAAEELPGFAMPWQNLDGEESSFGHEEDALHHAAIAIRLLPRDHEIAPAMRSAQIPLMRGEWALLDNDYAAARHEYEDAARNPPAAHMAETARQRVILAVSLLHDAAGTKAALDALPPNSDPSVRINRTADRLLSQYALGRWSALAAGYGEIEREVVAASKVQGTSHRVIEDALNRQGRPYFAVALAMHGEFAKANGMLKQTPLDCDACLRARARVAAAEHRWAAAEYWYHRVVGHAPSIALGYSEWGAMLLAKGDRDGAIAKFTVAHDKSPHFADPLEMWGEALIAKNRSDLALAKFQEADQYAPNWGRLHLKWGEALLWSGNRQAAAQQFARAAQLDLTSAEKAELSRLRHG